MKAGDVINGYTILEDFKVVGAGLSKWTFAERGGRQYFIKEFLSPTYPDDAAPGARRPRPRSGPVAPSSRPPPRHAAALAPLSAYGGNLIVTLDFFRWGAKYYKVTEKVDAEALEHRGHRQRSACRLQLVLMKSVAHSLKILHDLRIVHGDLKPSNVLIKRTELGYTTKLIDFDNSYIAGQPAAAARRSSARSTTTPRSCSATSRMPAWLPAELGVASDVFALGLIYTEFLTGALPPFDAADLPRARRGSPQRRDAAHPSGRDPPRAGRPGRRHAGRRPRPAAHDRRGTRHPDEPQVGTGGRGPTPSGIGPSWQGVADRGAAAPGHRAASPGPPGREARA